MISDIKYNVKLDKPLAKTIASCFGQVKQVNHFMAYNKETYEVLTFSVVTLDDIMKFEMESQFLVDSFFAKYDDGFTLLSIRIREKSIKEIRMQFRIRREEEKHG